MSTDIEESPVPAICVFAPSPILTITVEGSPEGIPEVHLHPGGQGFWVARMATQLGAEVRFCAPFGGETGALVRNLIAEAGITVIPVESQAANGAYIHDRRGGEREVIVETPGAALGRHESDDLYTAALAEAISARVAILTGPARPGILADGMFARLARDLKDNGVAVVADLSGEQLQEVAGLHTLKVSHEDLMRDGFVASEDLGELATLVSSFTGADVAQNIIISRAEKAALAFIRGTAYEIVPPKFEPLDHRGAGDSMTAAVAVGISRGMPIDECLKLGAAAGALNVTRHGLGTGRRESVEKLALQVQVRPVEL
jgi:1-phosphofructokinase